MAASPDGWSRFRGPNGSGVATGNEPLPTEIDPDKNVVWKTALPGGHSSPVLHGDRLYLTAERDRKLLTLALDSRSGAIVWERQARYRTQPVPAARSNPLHAKISRLLLKTLQLCVISLVE